MMEQHIQWRDVSIWLGFLLVTLFMEGMFNLGIELKRLLQIKQELNHPTPTSSLFKSLISLFNSLLKNFHKSKLSSKPRNPQSLQIIQVTPLLFVHHPRLTIPSLFNGSLTVEPLTI
jgi:hypothetical protein